MGSDTFSSWEFRQVCYTTFSWYLDYGTGWSYANLIWSWWTIDICHHLKKKKFCACALPRTGKELLVRGYDYANKTKSREQMKCSKPFLEVLRYLPDKSTQKFVDLIKNWGGLAMSWQKLIRSKKVYLFVSGREKDLFLISKTLFRMPPTKMDVHFSVMPWNRKVYTKVMI